MNLKINKQRKAQLTCSGYFHCLRTLLPTLVFIFIFSANSFAQGFATIDFHQAQNDRNGAKLYLIDWVNGSLNSTHTDYWEGIGVPQRVVLTGLKPNTALSNVNRHSIRFQILSSKGDKHAYDFPISWDQAFKTAEDIGGTVNELQNLFIQQCGDAFSAQAKAACGVLTDGVNDNVATAPFPNDIGNPGKPTIGAPNVNDNITCFETYKRFGESDFRYGDRLIEIRGNQTISNVSVSFNGYKGSGKDYQEYTLFWESASDIVMIRFATRLAPGNGRCGYGSGQGAGSISGAPYHVTLERLDDRDGKAGVSLGSQDNQIMSNAIQIPPPQCGLSNGSSGCTNSATSFTINYTSADAANATVKFYFTANTAGAKFQGTSVSAVGNCTTNTVSVTADGAGSASITVVPLGTNFTAGNFRVGACVTGAGGSTTCEQPSATVISEASVVAKVDGNVTTLASPATLNVLQANPSAALTSLGTLNGIQDNTLFSSFSWAVASVPAGTINNAVLANLSATNTADVTFTPTAANGGGFVTGLYAFEVTATSAGSGCVAKAKVYIDATGTATCVRPTGSTPVCENSQNLAYSVSPSSPGANLTYVWSIIGTATIDGADNVNGAGTKSGVGNITVDAGTSNFTVKLSIKADNGQVFSSSDCELAVTVKAKPTVQTQYNAPACNSKVFTVDVLDAKKDLIYSIDQDNEINFSAQTVTAASDGQAIRFTGLTAGDGFIVTVSNGLEGCSTTSSCDNNTPVCPTDAGKTQVSTNITEVVAKAAQTYNIVLESGTKVNAVPNPYTDKVRFNLISGVSGYGSLELYNTLGQKVAVVYQGYIKAGSGLDREYFVPKANRSTLIYVFKVGEQQVTGKLIGLK
jgi:hypothetical protein